MVGVYVNSSSPEINSTIFEPISELTDSSILSDVTDWIWIIISSILFVFGLIGNIGIFIVIFRLQKWKNITYFLLLILAVSDSVVLVTGLSRRWIQHVFYYDVRDHSDFECKLNVFMIYFSMHFSSWTLVCITVERFVKTKFPLRYRTSKFSRGLKTFYIASIVLCCVIDGHLITNNGLISIGNETLCNNTLPEHYIFEEKYFVFIDLVWLSLLPFSLMCVMNIFIGKTLRNSFRFRSLFLRDREYRQKNVRSSKRLTRMLFVTSIYFLMTTLPISVFFIVDSFTNTVSSSTRNILNFIEALLYLFQFSNYAANFYIYVKVNDVFRQSLFTMFKRSHKSDRTHSPHRTKLRRSGRASIVGINFNSSTDLSSTLSTSVTDRGTILSTLSSSVANGSAISSSSVSEGRADSSTLSNPDTECVANNVETINSISKEVDNGELQTGHRCGIESSTSSTFI